MATILTPYITETKDANGNAVFVMARYDVLRVTLHPGDQDKSAFTSFELLDGHDAEHSADNLRNLANLLSYSASRLDLLAGDAATDRD